MPAYTSKEWHTRSECPKRKKVSDQRPKYDVTQLVLLLQSAFMIELVLPIVQIEISTYTVPDATQFITFTEL